MGAVTQAASSYYFDFSDKTYKVIDCPGFMDDEEKNQKRVLSELCRSAVLARDGLDAIVFVINPTERFTDRRHEQAIYILESMGDTFWNHSFIMFTHEESMKTKDCPTSKSYLEYCIANPDQSKVFMKIFTKLNKRHMMIESVSSGCSHNNEYWATKVTEMTEHITVLNKSNKDIRFNCVMMEHGKQLYEKHFALLVEKQKLHEKLNVLKPMLKLYKSKKNEGNENQLLQLQVEVHEDEENSREIEAKLTSIKKEIKRIDDTMRHDVLDYENKSMSRFIAFSGLASAALIFGIVIMKILVK